MRHPTSTATPPGSPAPAPLSSPKSGAIKRQRKAAAPLSDVTNRLLPETPTPIKPRRTGLRPLPTPSDASSTCSTASVTPAPKPSSAAVIEEERSAAKSPISTVYARRGTTETQGRRRTTNPIATTKGKEPVAAAGTASCPPLGKATRKNSRKDSMAQDTRPISSSAPCHGARKKRPPPSTPKLPEDFVKKQRAYFADVDAFELAEEEVSESELE
ncbi:proteoglycan 4-like [Panicum miliaceum]|uniref:Proteoglycan 4-like n=1 Tax=Panicum miliaceum TaxID=4540 RepID=A0A3L6RCH5_PANMI|nr:proteoglycan 4-like [Panicum miliaceum]